MDLPIESREGHQHTHDSKSILPSNPLISAYPRPSVHQDHDANVISHGSSASPDDGQCEHSGMADKPLHQYTLTQKVRPLSSNPSPYPQNVELLAPSYNLPKSQTNGTDVAGKASTQTYPLPDHDLSSQIFPPFRPTTSSVHASTTHRSSNEGSSRHAMLSGHSTSESLSQLSTSTYPHRQMKSHALAPALQQQQPTLASILQLDTTYHYQDQQHQRQQQSQRVVSPATAWASSIALPHPSQQDCERSSELVKPAVYPTALPDLSRSPTDSSTASSNALPHHSTRRSLYSTHSLSTASQQSGPISLDKQHLPYVPPPRSQQGHEPSYYVPQSQQSNRVLTMGSFQIAGIPNSPRRGAPEHQYLDNHYSDDDGDDEGNNHGNRQLLNRHAAGHKTSESGSPLPLQGTNHDHDNHTSRDTNDADIAKPQQRSTVGRGLYHHHHHQDHSYDDDDDDDQHHHHHHAPNLSRYASCDTAKTTTSCPNPLDTVGVGTVYSEHHPSNASMPTTGTHHQTNPHATSSSAGLHMAATPTNHHRYLSQNTTTRSTIRPKAVTPQHHQKSSSRVAAANYRREPHSESPVTSTPGSSHLLDLRLKTALTPGSHHSYTRSSDRPQNYGRLTMRSLNGPLTESFFAFSSQQTASQQQSTAMTPSTDRNQVMIPETRRSVTIAVNLSSGESPDAQLKELQAQSQSPQDDELTRLKMYRVHIQPEQAPAIGKPVVVLTEDDKGMKMEAGAQLQRNILSGNQNRFPPENSASASSSPYLAQQQQHDYHEHQQHVTSRHLSVYHSTSPSFPSTALSHHHRAVTGQSHSGQQSQTPRGDRYHSSTTATQGALFPPAATRHLRQISDTALPETHSTYDSAVYAGEHPSQAPQTEHVPMRTLPIHRHPVTVSRSSSQRGGVLHQSKNGHGSTDELEPSIILIPQHSVDSHKPHGQHRHGAGPMRLRTGAPLPAIRKEAIVVIPHPPVISMTRAFSDRDHRHPLHPGSVLPDEAPSGIRSPRGFADVPLTAHQACDVETETVSTTVSLHRKHPITLHFDHSQTISDSVAEAQAPSMYGDTTTRVDSNGHARHLPAAAVSLPDSNCQPDAQPHGMTTMSVIDKDTTKNTSNPAGQLINGSTTASVGHYSSFHHHPQSVIRFHRREKQLPLRYTVIDGTRAAISQTQTGFISHHGTSSVPSVKQNENDQYDSAIPLTSAPPSMVSAQCLSTRPAASVCLGVVITSTKHDLVDGERTRSSPHLDHIIFPGEKSTDSLNGLSCDAPVQGSSNTHLDYGPSSSSLSSSIHPVRKSDGTALRDTQTHAHRTMHVCLTLPQVISIIPSAATKTTTTTTTTLAVSATMALAAQDTASCAEPTSNTVYRKPHAVVENTQYIDEINALKRCTTPPRRRQSNSCGDDQNRSETPPPPPPPPPRRYESNFSASPRSNKTFQNGRGGPLSHHSFHRSNRTTTVSTTTTAMGGNTGQYPQLVRVNSSAVSVLSSHSSSHSWNHGAMVLSSSILSSHWYPSPTQQDYGNIEDIAIPLVPLPDDVASALSSHQSIGRLGSVDSSDYVGYLPYGTILRDYKAQQTSLLTPSHSAVIESSADA